MVFANFFLAHGFALWASWSLLALLQISSNRYLKGPFWKINMWIHRVVGTVMMAFTLGFGFKAWNKLGGKVINNAHSYFAFPVLLLVFFIAIGGVITRSCLRRQRWNTRKALLMKKLHKYAAYFILVSGFLAVAAGILAYRTNPKHPSDFPLERLHMAGYLLVFAALETHYQMTLQKEEEFDSSKVESINVEEFERRVARGEKLVVLDNLVLDVAAFLDNHPGGRFSLEQNIGRDVSKFFYGGYSLEQEVEAHTHSN